MKTLDTGQLVSRAVRARSTTHPWILDDSCAGEVARRRLAAELTLEHGAASMLELVTEHARRRSAQRRRSARRVAQ